MEGKGKTKMMGSDFSVLRGLPNNLVTNVI